MIFQKYCRSDARPKQHSETTFAHLNRSARPPIECVRQLIEQWVSRFPERDAAEIARRIVCGDDTALFAAFLELFTHELLLATGHTVSTHPAMHELAKRPDFMALDSNGNRTIVECTLVTELSVATRGALSRLDALYDSINRVISPDFFLSLRIHGSPNTPVPSRKWRDCIQRWVVSLDYEAIRGKRSMEMPDLDLVHDGLHLNVSPIPKKPSARGLPGQPIGIQSFPATFVTSRRVIRDTVRDKAGRYGQLHCPYVIVVNCIHDHADDEEIHEAMYGAEGLWPDRGQPAHTRVSAVLAVRHLLPWCINSSSIRLFHNPHAKHPYEGALSQLVNADACDAALSCGQLVGIDSDWPYWSEDTPDEH